MAFKLSGRRVLAMSRSGGYLAVAIPIMTVVWIVFKRCYPYADYFTDSYTYIHVAAVGDAISFRPVGYSLFLRAVHSLTQSDTLLVTLQYALVQGASMGLFLTLVKRCGLRGPAARIVLAFLLLNPTVPWLCNFISSDALFVGLSLIWITVLMGMIREPSWWRLCLQGVLLLVIFNLRYAALFYPAVAALSFLLLRKKASLAFKLTGIAGSIGIVIACMAWIKHMTYKRTGADVFSAFSGWQIAGNVMNLYPYIPVDTAGLPSPECRELAMDAYGYFRKAAPALLSRGPRATTDYLWLQYSPLHLYMSAMRSRERTGYFTAWNRVAPVFTEYGYFVMRRHPAAFLRYYVWPSARTFFVPPLDEFAVYNDGSGTVDPVARDWFGYAGLKIRAWSYTAPARIFAPVAWIYLLLNIVFVMTTLLFLWSRQSRERNPVFMSCLELVSAFLLSNACFGIFASPSILRYQVLTMILLFPFIVNTIYLLPFRYGFSFIARHRRDR